VVSYTVSARKREGHLKDFLESNYPSDIDSVFGFAEFSSLYGGRPFWGEELSQNEIKWLYSEGIGYRIPCTNHNISEGKYTENLGFLDKYHRAGNTIIAVNDDFARWVKRDFPLYEVEASAIKKLDRIDKINKALDLYHTVVLPADCNDNTKLLKSIIDKSRVRLFARAGCAYTCPSRICYKSFSEHMDDKSIELLCSIPIKQRPLLGITDFDIQPLVDMGFTKFKMVPR